MMDCKKSSTFLGLDLSTQQLKVIAIDNELCIIGEEVVNFDKDLPEFETHGGVKRHEDALTVTAPSLMWVKAFDLLLERMKSKGFCFQNVACISGTGQQHGSVYWRSGAKMRLKNLDPSKCLHEQLKVLGVMDRVGRRRGSYPKQKNVGWVLKGNFKGALANRFCRPIPDLFCEGGLPSIGNDEISRIDENRLCF